MYPFKPKTYDFLKWYVAVLGPALITLVAGVGAIIIGAFDLPTVGMWFGIITAGLGATNGFIKHLIDESRKVYYAELQERQES